MEGGRVGTDSLFDSVEKCVEPKKHLNVYSTFIIKQNVNYFLMQVLHKIILLQDMDQNLQVTGW